MDTETAMARAEQAGNGRGDDLVASLAERLGGHANAGAVFGEPVSEGGVTVIPVAKVRYGFGGGWGQGTDEEGEHGSGGGGGGGMGASPLGFIEIRDGEASFRRVKDPVALLPVIIGGAVASWIFARALRALFR